MTHRITTFVCAFGLAVIWLVTPPNARSQAPPQDRAPAARATEWPQQAVRGTHAMVATDEELGSQAGVEILKRGGNAIDAAVAVAFALAVVEPAAGNIGGGGFMLVRLANGKAAFLDYRELAPAKTTRDMYIKPDGKIDEETSVVSYKAVAASRTVAGLELASRKLRPMKLAAVMEP